MKVLYACTLDSPLGTNHSRFVGLQKIQANVELFDGSSMYDELRKIGRCFRDLAFSRLSTDISNKLVAACRQTQPDILWLDTGEWITPSAVNQIRAWGTFMVRHTTDALYPRRPLLLRFRRRRLRRTFSMFDLVFTSNECDQHRLKAVLGEKVHLTDLGYDESRFNDCPISLVDQAKWANDIIFVGHHEARTEAAVLALIDAGIKVTIFGNASWFKSKNKHRLKPYLQNGLSNCEYETALKATKIGLCCVSEWNYNQTAGRSFEIPGSGTFLLAMRTPRHLEFYREGIEAEFFGDHDELVRKAQHYLNHDDERTAIAAAGHRRCVDSGYAWGKIMQRDWHKTLLAYDLWKAK